MRLAAEKITQEKIEKLEIIIEEWLSVKVTPTPLQTWESIHILKPGHNF